MICAPCSVHVILTYYMRKGSWAFVNLATHKSTGSESPITRLRVQGWVILVNLRICVYTPNCGKVGVAQICKYVQNLRDVCMGAVLNGM